MKKIFTLITFLAIAFASNAQYYYYSRILIAQNPGGLNTDIEQPGQAGWNTIQATSATPVWSPVTTIPIPFSFNGSPVTSFKVSTSGVLTFTTAAVAVPASTSAALPTASIPDNSICVWGLAGTGANDNIMTKTFGTTPNRQFWVQFNSYSCIGSTGWTYWGIVLEETTNKVYLVDQRNYNAPLALSVGIQVNATTAYAVAGSPSVGSYSNGGSLDDASDNSYYEFIQGVQPAFDVQLFSANVPNYILAPANANISGQVSNLGTSTITGLTLKYQSGVNVYSDVRTGLNILPSQTWNFTHNNPFNVATPNRFPLKIWVELTGDNNQTNDTLNKAVSGLAFLPPRNVVFEEATGTWCGWCPRGAVFMDSLAIVHPTRAMLVAVHNADPMVVSAYDAGMGALIGGYPSGLVDRKIIDTDPSYFFNAYNQLINDTVPCEVDVTTTINASTRVATIVVNGHFAGELSGDYRLNAVVTEDDVTGTTSSYNQSNYYSYQSQNLPLVGAGHNWQAEPSTIPAANMQYDHVARAILGGFNGLASSLPTSIAANSNYNHTFNYTVPATYNLNNLKIIGWVSEFSSKQIFNSGLSGITIITGVDEVDNAYQLSVYPNPSTGIVNISSAVKNNIVMKMNVINSLGETVVSFDRFNLNAGLQIDLSRQSNGLYYIQFIDANNTTSVSKIMINR
ncbi:MAG: Omp28-related outer membrane protein [Bacteroidia bacterium]|nr:Omp28-related outer membrane protein [Bacteroidia bacterium]